MKKIFEKQKKQTKPKHQNGKGSAPRNITQNFKKNYEQINWKKMKKVAVSGYFDPIHVGHLEYLNLSKKLGDYLIVIVNNDHQCKLKKGKPFMKEEDRMAIVKALSVVDEVFLSIDEDKSVCKSLEALKPNIFANGGDRSIGEVPETPICNKYGIEMVDEMGKKIRSSSDLTGLKSI